MNRWWLTFILLSSLFSKGGVWSAGAETTPAATLPRELVVAGAPAGAITVDYYPIEGRTLAELRRALRENGPVDSGGVARDAFAGWHMTWRWPRRADGSPDFESVEVRCTGTVRLPRWSPPEGTDTPLIAEWDRYLRAVMDHERRHLEHCFADREAVRAAIVRAARERVDLTPADAHRVARQVLKETRARDRALDAITDHGKKHGALLAQTLPKSATETRALTP